MITKRVKNLTCSLNMRRCLIKNKRPSIAEALRLITLLALYEKFRDNNYYIIQMKCIVKVIPQWIQNIQRLLPKQIEGGTISVSKQKNSRAIRNSLEISHLSQSGEDLLVQTPVQFAETRQSLLQWRIP